MNIFTNVTNGIRPRQKEYLQALNDIAGEDKEILADVADNNVLTARRLIAEHTTYPVTVYKSYGGEKPLTFAITGLLKQALSLGNSSEITLSTPGF